MKNTKLLTAILSAAMLTACGNDGSTDDLYTVSESRATTLTVTMPEFTEKKPENTKPGLLNCNTVELHTENGVKSLTVAEYYDYDKYETDVISRAEFYTDEDGERRYFQSAEPIYLSLSSDSVYVSKTQNYIADNYDFVRYRFDFDNMTVTAEYDKLYSNEYLSEIMDTINDAFAEDKDLREKMQFNKAGAYWNNVRVGVLTEDAVEPMNEYLLGFGYDPDAFVVVVDTSVVVPTSGTDNISYTAETTSSETDIKPAETVSVKSANGERAPIVMMSVHTNFAWGFQQSVYALDAEGNYYSFSTEDESEYFNVSTESWYDRLSELEPIEQNEYYYTAGEKSLKAIADFSEKLPELYKYGMKEYWEYNSADAGTISVYGIYAEKDGTPNHAELCSFGDHTACLENNDAVDFVNEMCKRNDMARIFSNFGSGFEFYYPDVYPDLPPMEESHEKKVIEDYAEFMGVKADYVRIQQYYGTYNGWDALVMESGELGYTDDEKLIDIAGYKLGLSSGGLDIHMYKDGEFVDIETAYKSRRIISTGEVAAIDYYNGHAGLYVPASEYKQAEKENIPLSERQQEAIRYAYSTFANVWAENIRIIEYYGTYRNCEAVVLSPGYGTADEHYFTAAGHKMYLPSGSLNIYLHKEGSFYTLEEAYEKGFITETEIELIALENRGRYSFAF